LQAISDANVVICVFDAREGVVDQDLHMLGFALDAGRSLVIAVNKWDGMDADDKRKVKNELNRRLEFVGYAKIHFISALHGTAVGDLYGSVDKAYASATTRWSTNKLTSILQQATTEHAPPMVNGRRIKLRMAHLGGTNPPRFIIHGNQTEKVPNNYTRFLENTYRKALKIEGTPVFIEYKSGTNPFEGRKNLLTQRQIGKKQRLVEHARHNKRGR